MAIKMTSEFSETQYNLERNDFLGLIGIGSFTKGKKQYNEYKNLVYSSLSD